MSFFTRPEEIASEHELDKENVRNMQFFVNEHAWRTPLDIALWPAAVLLAGYYLAEDTRDAIFVVGVAVVLCLALGIGLIHRKVHLQNDLTIETSRRIGRTVGGGLASVFDQLRQLNGDRPYDREDEDML